MVLLGECGWEKAIRSAMLPQADYLASQSFGFSAHKMQKIVICRIRLM